MTNEKEPISYKLDGLAGLIVATLFIGTGCIIEYNSIISPEFNYPKLATFLTTGCDLFGGYGLLKVCQAGKKLWELSQDKK